MQSVTHPIASAARALDARNRKASHHGTFQLTDEAIDAPATALGVALDEARVPRERFAVLQPGQVVEL